MNYGISNGNKYTPLEAKENNITCFCPQCGEPLIPVIPVCNIEKHWRHYKETNCPYSVYESEGEWHFKNKMLFPRKYVEVKNGETINDVLLPGRYAIEFQNSSITALEIIRRQQFARFTYWVFNLESQFRRGQLWTDENNRFRYRHPKRIFEFCNMAYWYADDLIFIPYPEREVWDENDGGYPETVIYGTYEPYTPSGFAAMMMKRHPEPPEDINPVQLNLFQ